MKKYKITYRLGFFRYSHIIESECMSFAILSALNRIPIQSQKRLYDFEITRIG